MSTSQSALALVADIGGTHIRLAQCRGTTLMAIEKYRCADFSGLPEAIDRYLRSRSLGSIDSACLAVAAPLDSDEIIMTNNEWRFSISAIQQQFELTRVVVVNDFEAIACAIPQLPDSDRWQLGGVEADPSGNIAVLGPGTGLGVKHLIATGKSWKVLAGEGGHVDFAPVDNNDLALWCFLHDRGQPIAMEDILSGRGLVNIYQCIVARKKGQASFDDPETILRQGLSRASSECTEAIYQFMNILGSFAGNLALNLKTTGGVYLCGGVLAELKDLIPATAFRERFEAKGRFRFYVQDIPVFLITAEEPGLLGAAVYFGSTAPTG
ncbi:MAG: glucokinase [Gammaproteobacteria bacterium]|nr:glucokinase [Gammaproteobacteria bacterium]